MVDASRPFDVSSRFFPTEGPLHPWTTGEVKIDLPVIVDRVHVDPDTGEEIVRIEARVDLNGGTPEVVKISFAAAGLDLGRFKTTSAGPPR